MLTTRPQQTSAAPLPLIQQITPKFLKIKDATDIVQEAKELVYLRLIQCLTAEELGVDDDDKALLIKLKSLMILHAHEIFLAKQTWADKFKTMHIDVTLKNIRNCFSVSFIYGMFSTNPQVGEQWATFEARLIAKSKPFFDVFTKQAENYILVCAELFPGWPLLDPAIYKVVMTEAQTLIVSLLVDHWKSELSLIPQLGRQPVNSDAIRNSLFGKMHAIRAQLEFKLLVENELKEFNFAVSNKVFLLNDSQITTLCQRYNMEAEKSKFTELHKEYGLFYDKFSQLVTNTTGHIQKHLPNFSLRSFSILYTIAFERLTGSESIYLSNLLCEIYLQQARRPHMQPDILKLLTEHYIPTANAYNSQIGMMQVITLEDVIEWVRVGNEGAIATSLQQIISESYIALHSDPRKLRLDTKPVPLQITFPVPVEEKGSSVAISLTMGPNPSSQLMVISEPKPLFTGKVPGALVQEDMNILNGTAEHMREFAIRFTRFSKFPSLDIQANDRENARICFLSESQKCDSPAKIAALVAVAEPYINRHRHNIYDALTKKKNTKTWNKIVSVARTTAISQLKTQVASRTVTVETLQVWQQHTFFAAHRNTSKYKGAFGKTRSQGKIEKLITEVQKQQSGPRR